MFRRIPTRTRPVRIWSTASLLAVAVFLTACGTAGGPDSPPANQSPAPGETSASPSTSESTSESPSESPSSASPEPSATETATPEPTPEPSPTASATPSQRPTASGIMDARLKVELTADGADYMFTYTLNCLGVRALESSFHPNDEAACRVLTLRGEKVLFAKKDPTRACTQQYGGPQRARVFGTLNGRAVDAAFSKTDGCEIQRWMALEALFRSAQNP